MSAWDMDLDEQEVGGIKLDDPSIQWVRDRPVRGWSGGKTYCGFTAPLEENGELDDFLRDKGWKPMTIQHMGGEAQHWPIQGPFHVLCTRPKTSRQLDASPERFGIKYFWTQKGHRVVSKAITRVWPADLLGAGWNKPCLLTLSSFDAVDWLNITVQHIDMSRALKDIRVQKGGDPKDKVPPYWYIGIDLKPGEPVSRGSSQTTVVTPFAYQGPVAPRLDLQASAAYIKTRFLPRDMIEHIGGYVDETLAWASGYIHTKEEAEAELAANPKREWGKRRNEDLL